MTGSIPCVVYAAKSTENDNESIQDQLRAIDQRLSVEADRFLFAEPFSESERSGFRHSRGPELEAALRAADEAAETHGTAELWVWQSNRLARGTGRKNEARSLLEIFVQTKRAGIRLRSITDDGYIQDEATIGLASQLAAKYSEDLSTNVSRGKRTQREEGARSGGALPDGFLQSKQSHPLNPNRMVSVYGLDPDREAVYRLLVQRGIEGVPEIKIATELNSHGWTTKAGTTKKGKQKGGNPFTRKSVQNTLKNPFYFGGNGWFVGTEREEIFWDSHQGYGSREDFEEIRRRFEKRARGPVPEDRPQGGIGRPNENYLLGSTLGRCRRCNKSVRGVTSTYIRADGTRKKNYICGCVIDGGDCDLPKIDATLVDGEVMRHLGDLFIDFDKLLRSMTEAQDVEVGTLEEERSRLAIRLAQVESEQGAVADRLRKRLTEGDDQGAAILEGVLKEQQPERQDLDKAIRKINAKIERAQETTPADASLDALGSIRDKVRVALERGSLREAREDLEDHFVAFVLDKDEAGDIEVTPVLSQPHPIYGVWQQTATVEAVPITIASQAGSEDGGLASPEAKNPDSWESLAAVPD
jgi:DNA invertase Pin-like site-specific DNA recombinase